MEKLKILAAGDLHGDIDVAKKLAKKGKKEKVDLVILAGDIHGYMGEGKGILKPFEEARQKVLFIPGNLDFDEELENLSSGKNIHNYYVNYKGVGIAGIGSPNWKLSLKDEDLENIRGNMGKMKAKKKILVSHLHVADTLAEFSGVPGEMVLKQAIEEFHPNLLIAAHIHEGEGIEDVVGKTKVVQVGRKGTILKI